MEDEITNGDMSQIAITVDENELVQQDMQNALQTGQFNPDQFHEENQPNSFVPVGSFGLTNRGSEVKKFELAGAGVSI